MEHKHEWSDFTIVTTFALQFDKVQSCECGLFRVIQRGSTEWEVVRP